MHSQVHGSETIEVKAIIQNPIPSLSCTTKSVIINASASKIGANTQIYWETNGGVLFSLIIIDFSAVQPLLSVTITRYLPGLVTSGIGSVETINLIGQAPQCLLQTVLHQTSLLQEDIH